MDYYKETESLAAKAQGMKKDICELLLADNNLYKEEIVYEIAKIDWHGAYDYFKGLTQEVCDDLFEKYKTELLAILNEIPKDSRDEALSNWASDWIPTRWDPEDEECKTPLNRALLVADEAGRLVREIARELNINTEEYIC